MHKTKRKKRLVWGFVLTFIPPASLVPVLIAFTAVTHGFSNYVWALGDMFYIYIGVYLVAEFWALVKFWRAYDRKYDPITVWAFVGSLGAIVGLLFLAWWMLVPFDRKYDLTVVATLVGAFIGMVAVVSLVWRLMPPGET